MFDVSIQGVTYQAVFLMSYQNAYREQITDVFGFLVDLSRGVTRAATAYHQGTKPEIKVGRQLAGQACLVDLRRHAVKQQAKALQQFATVRRGRPEDQPRRRSGY